MSRSPAHVALVALVAVAVACGPATDTPPELGTVPRVAASPAPEATPEATPDEVESRARGNGIRVADGAAREALNKHRERLSEERELAIKYADGALGDALTTKRLLLVDAAAPADTREVRYYLLRGDVPTPASFDALKDARGEDGGRASSFVLGGEDAARPGLFRDVDEGRYTACAVVGPPEDPARKAALARAATELEAEIKATGKSMAEALKTTGGAVPRPPKIEWSAYPVRCAGAEITGAPVSRVVVLAGS